MKRWTIVAVIALPLLAIGAFAVRWLTPPHNITTQDGGKSFGYKVSQAPAYFFEGLGWKRRIYWVDDQRVLFLGLSEKDHGRMDLSNGSRVYGVLLWDTASGELKEIGRAIGDLCFFEGRLSYLEYFDEEKLITRKGSLTETIQHVDPRWEHMTEAREARGERDHPFNCETYNVTALDPEGRCRTPLIRGDGLLDTTGRRCSEDAMKRRLAIPQTARDDEERRAMSRDFEYELANRPVLYFNTPDSPPIELDIKTREINPLGFTFTYSPWAHAYSVVAKASRTEYWRGSWPKGAPFVVYLIYPGGKINAFFIPWNDVIRRIPLTAAPTRRGLILVNKDRPSMAERGPAGLYLLQNDTPRHIYAGDVTDVAVSPDGCKAAFDVRFETVMDGVPFVRYVRAIDLCASE